jgi:hypothetical protein
MVTAEVNSLDPTRTRSMIRSPDLAHPSLHPVISLQRAPLMWMVSCHLCGASQRQGGPHSGDAEWLQRRSGGAMWIPPIIPSQSVPYL